MEAVPPRHVSTECPLSFAHLEAQHSGRNYPLSQVALGGFPWPRVTGPDGPEAGPASLPRAGLACTGAFCPA